MTDPTDIAEHYQSGHLLERITAGCAALGLGQPIPHGPSRRRMSFTLNAAPQMIAQRARVAVW